MLRAYILGKDRQWRGTRVPRRSEGCFQKGSFEYEINPEAIYWRRLMGIKLIRSIEYHEGCRKALMHHKIPMVKDDGSGYLRDEKGNILYEASLSYASDVPLAEIEMIVSRALKNIIIIISCLCSAGALACALITLIKIWPLTGGA